MLPWPIARSWQDIRSEKIAGQIKESSFDVILLQEAFIGKFRKAVLEKTKEIYPHQFYLDKNSFLFPFVGSGLFVLSRHPFKVLENVYFDECNRADCLASKGVSLIEMTYPSGKVIQFAHTHLQAGERFGSTRMKQLEQISGLLKKHKKNGVPQILTGDLNIDLYQSEFKGGLDLTRMRFLTLTGDITYTNRLKNKCYRTPGNGMDHGWIDHIWVNDINPLPVMQVKVMTFVSDEGMTCALSDHHALQAHITF